jgi:sporulation protein YlmC with PRC-barrel domain
MIRLSNLRNAKVRTVDGEILGNIHEVHCDGARIIALTCGPGSFLERLTARSHGRRIPWEYVLEVRRKEVVVAPDPPRRSSSGSRTRRRTRQANARRSAR